MSPYHPQFLPSRLIAALGGPPPPLPPCYATALGPHTVGAHDSEGKGKGTV